MGGDHQQQERIRQRLSHLLNTHRDQLAASTWIAERGQVVIEQGARAETVLLVEAGELGVESLDDQGKATMLATVGAGELLGEMGLFGDCRHTARVTVTSDTVSLLRLDSDALLQAVMFDAELALEILALNSRRCQQSNRHLKLLIEGLQALHDGHQDNLRACCAELNQGPASLRLAGALLMDLFLRFGGQTPLQDWSQEPPPNQS